MNKFIYISQISISHRIFIIKCYCPKARTMMLCLKKSKRFEQKKHYYANRNKYVNISLKNINKRKIINKG